MSPQLPNDKVAWTEKSITQRLQGLFEPLSTLQEDLLRPYREAAAVLPYFYFHKLRPIGATSIEVATPIEFAEECEPSLSEEKTPVWSIRTSLRRKTLSTLLAEDRIEIALSANERGSGILHKLLESSLRNRRLDISNLPSKELSSALVVRDWLDGVIEHLPSVAEIHHRIDQQALIEPLLFLVGDTFAGREDQLNELADYVGVKQASHLRESIMRGYEKVFNIHQRPPLFVFGPGGIGKSTLLAKFILDHISKSNKILIPFAYLDFDRPVVDSADPSSILFEIARQLSVQYPESETAFKTLTEQWDIPVPSPMPIETTHIKVGSKQVVIGDRAQEQNEWRLDQFLAYTRSILKDLPPLLVVLDTFEEVQFTSRAHAIGVFKLLESLQQRLPKLRLVLAGRVTPDLEEYHIKPLKLEEFDKKAAIAFLQKQRITNGEAAATIADNVQGSPLVLKLAAELWLKGETTDLIKGNWLEGVFGKTTETQLYTRILEHIHDPEVRKLAHPGLILRKVTPEIIWKVLAGPCSLEVKELSTAQAIFNKLKKEFTLVRSIDANTLEHRQDIRALMIRDIRRDIGPERVRDIHEKAVNYYEGGRGDTDRAEELYHRLSLGIDRKTLNTRWTDKAMMLLPRTAVLELPPESQAYVAARIPIEIDETMWEKADQSDWEKYTERVAREALGSGNTSLAFSVSQTRSARLPESRLIPLDIEIQAKMGQIEQAEKRLAEAFPVKALSGDPSTLFSYARTDLGIRELSPTSTLESIAPDKAFQILKKLEQSNLPDSNLLFLSIGYFKESKSWPRPDQFRILQQVIKLLRKAGPETFQSSPQLLREWITIGAPGTHIGEFGEREWFALARACLANFDLEDIQPLISSNVLHSIDSTALRTPDDQLAFLVKAFERSARAGEINQILLAIITQQPEFLTHVLRIQPLSSSTSPDPNLLKPKTKYEKKVKPKLKKK